MISLNFMTVKIATTSTRLPQGPEELGCYLAQLKINTYLRKYQIKKNDKSTRGQEDLLKQ